MFWSQHPGEWFSLQWVTDGRLEAFWDARAGQFVTVPGREDDQAPATPSPQELPLQHLLPTLRSSLSQHRQQGMQHVLEAGQSARWKGRNTKEKQQGR